MSAPIPDPTPGPRLYTPPEETPPDNPPACQSAARLRILALRRLVRPDDDRPSLRPAKVVAALPGTPEKVRAMAERVARGESPFHPDDLTVADAKALGYAFEVQPNGAATWFRPVPEEERREFIERRLAELRAAQRERQRDARKAG